MFFLECISGTEEGKFYRLKKNDWIGRSGECQVVLPCSQISNRSLMVKEVANQLSIVDYGSANGIIVKGVRYSAVRIHSSAVFTLGDLTFRVHMKEEELPEKLGFFVAENDNWKEVFRSFAQNPPNFTNSHCPLHWFPHPVKISFLEGLQSPFSWELLYGTQHFGTHFTYEIQEPLEELKLKTLDEESKKEPLFSLFYSENSFQMTFSPYYKIFVNGQKTNWIILKDTTLIQIGKSKIEVKILL